MQKVNIQFISKQFQILSRIKGIKVYIPDKTNLTIWHVSFEGQCGTPFQDGFYHCLLNLEKYPEQAPEVTFQNQNGAYKVGEKVCISGITHYHNSDWTQGTSIESVVVALRLYMTSTDRTGLGFIPQIDEKICQQLAIKSHSYQCSCGCEHSIDFPKK